MVTNFATHAMMTNIQVVVGVAVGRSSVMHPIVYPLWVYRHCPQHQKVLQVPV